MATFHLYVASTRLIRVLQHVCFINNLNINLMHEKTHKIQNACIMQGLGTTLWSGYMTIETTQFIPSFLTALKTFQQIA